jgi:hypothetical protein
MVDVGPLLIRRISTRTPPLGPEIIQLSISMLRTSPVFSRRVNVWSGSSIDCVTV